MDTKWDRFLLSVIVFYVGLGAGLYTWEKGKMASGYPDWTKAVALIGQDPDGNLILIQVDANGQLTVPFKGVNPSAELVTVAVDADGQLYSIMKGTDGNIMAVDANGYMTAVLKGDYEGALRTIGLDDEGRISGYLVDAEDQWGQTLKVGSAEQAARLGSFITWDRRGQVQRAIDFSRGFAGLQCTTYITGTTITLDPTYWWSGGYAAKITTAADANAYAYLSGRLGTPPSARYGLSLAFALENTVDHVYIRISHYKGTTHYDARIQYDAINHELNYYSDAGTYVKIADMEFKESVYSFHNLKMVVNMAAGMYARVLYNDTESVITQACKENTVPSGPGYVIWRVYVKGRAAGARTCYVDNIIFTVNEP